MTRLARPAAVAVLVAAIAVVLSFLINPAPAQDTPLDGYVARLSVDDHYNSKGVRLDNTAAIIRQDRANFHKFGIRDPEDESDGYFSNVQNRARLEQMLRRGSTPGWVHDAVVNGTPMISVTIYNDFVEVTILDENTGGDGGVPGGGAPGGGGVPPGVDGGDNPPGGGGYPPGGGNGAGDVEPTSLPANKGTGTLKN